jgi:hypothetical protein
MIENLPLKPKVLLHIITNAIFALLALIVTTLRLVARKILQVPQSRRNPLGIDDLFIICAMVGITPWISA